MPEDDLTRKFPGKSEYIWPEIGRQLAYMAKHLSSWEGWVSAGVSGVPWNILGCSIFGPVFGLGGADIL